MIRLVLVVIAREMSMLYGVMTFFDLTVILVLV